MKGQENEVKQPFAAAPPPAYEEAETKVPIENKLSALQRVAERYEMAGGAIAKLRLLEGYDIVVIADDSSSMARPAHAPAANRPFDKVPSRWDELKQRTTQIMDIACCLDQDGIDIYFLNRPAVFNVNDARQAEAIFSAPPQGYTPLSECYKRVLTDKLSGKEGRVMIIIATDGEPNRLENGGWLNDVAGFEHLLKTRAQPQRSPTMIMACTDSDYEIGWLNKLDDAVPYFDVVDDFEAEKAEILRAQGSEFRFTQGDYVVKTLLGPIIPLYDNLDERRLTRVELAEYLGVDINTLPRESQCFCAVS